MEQKSNVLLKVAGILMIIGGAIGLIVAIIALLGVGLLAAMGVNIGLLTFAAVLALVSSIVSFIGGIVGVKNAAKPQKAMTCIVFGILAVILTIIGTILTMSGGGDFPVVSLLTGLVIPAVYLIGAFQNKKKAA